MPPMPAIPVQMRSNATTPAMPSIPLPSSAASAMPGAFGSAGMPAPLSTPVPAPGALGQSAFANSTDPMAWSASDNPAPPTIPPTAPGPVGGSAAPMGPNGFAGAVAAAPVRSKKKIIAIASAVLAVLLVAALAFIIPNFQAVKAVLGFRPNNPLVVTADALNSMSTLRSTKYKLDAKDLNSDGSGDFSVSGMYSLGNTTDESSGLAVLNPGINGNNTSRFAWDKGSIVVPAGGGGDCYYLSPGQLSDGLDHTVGDEWANLILGVKDALVKNGKFDIVGTEQVFFDKLKSFNDSSLSQEAEKYESSKLSDAQTAEQTKLMQQYFGVELEKKDVMASLFPEMTSHKSGGVTQLTYQIDVKAFAQHFVNYWSDHESEYPQLRSRMITNIENEGVDDAESQYRKKIDSIRNWDFSAEGLGDDPSMPVINVELSYGKKRLLNSISFHIKYEGTEIQEGMMLGAVNLKISLALSGQNTVSVDDSELTDLIDKAKRNNELSDY
jgi:hypothetical protein